MTRVVIANDHAIVRHGLRALLEAERDLEVVGEATDGPDALRVAERLLPDVLVLDVAMPGLGGLEVARQVAQRFHEIKIIILSMHAAESYVLEALRSGVLGYVLKDSTTSDFVEAVRTVQSGRRYLSAPLSERAIDAYVERANVGSLDPYEGLTSREREVLHLAAEGHSNAVIADRLSISPRTAEVHVGNVRRKLGLQNQTDLLRYALRRGLLPPES